jgi:hypothetical protein
MEVHMDNPTVVETPTCTELAAEPAARPLAQGNAGQCGSQSAGNSASVGRKRLPNRREHTLVNFTTLDGFRYTAGLGYFDDGRLAEIFLNADKIGTAIETAARDSAVVASPCIAAWRPGGDYPTRAYSKWQWRSEWPARGTARPARF